MKTVEINLIGNLKQRLLSAQVAMPKAEEGSKEAQQQKQKLIIWGLAGASVFSLLIVGVLVVALLLWNFLLVAPEIKKTETNIESATIELARVNKVQSTLINEKKDLLMKAKIKKYLELQKIPIPEVIEELKVKAPLELFLSEVKNTPKGLLVTGVVSKGSFDPLKQVSLYIVNINKLQPEVSLVRNAIMANAEIDNYGDFVFSIVADVKPQAQPEEEKPDKKKKR